jgi:hypothetical protein
VATIKGGDKLAAKLAELAKLVARPATLHVGFFEKSSYPDGKPVALIAAIQEFGAPSRGIPPRPFFRNMVAAKSGEWPAAIAGLLRANGMDAAGALEVAGQRIAGQLQESINQTNSPPLAASTIARKGHSKPLIDSGRLWQSVAHEVRTT